MHNPWVVWGNLTYQFTDTGDHNRQGPVLMQLTVQRGKTELGSNILFIVVKYLLYLKILNEGKKWMVFWKMKYNPLETVAEE